MTAAPRRFFSLRAAWLCAAVFLTCRLSAPGQNVSLLPPFASVSTVRSGEQTDAAQSGTDAWLLPVRFPEGAERVYWDIPLAGRIPEKATALEIDLACSRPEPIRGLSLHAQSGDGWYSYSLGPVPAGRRCFDLPLGNFQAEDVPGPWKKADTFRISVWRNAAASGTATLTLYALRARTDTVAIVRATERTAPGETAFAQSLSDRCARLLTKAGVPFAVTGDDFETLERFKLLFLPYAPSLSDDAVRRLTRYLDKGGRLVAFYNASQPLAAAVGFRIGSWQGTDEGAEWSALLCDRAALPFVPPRVPHFTSNLLPPFPAGTRHARVLAQWADAGGRATDLPACVLSDRGAWFAHVPPLASPPAAVLFRALVCALVPDLREELADAAVRENRSLLDADEPATRNARDRLQTALRARAFETVPSLCDDLRNAAAAAVSAELGASAGELRGAWEPRGCGRTRQGWETLMRTLAGRGVNTLFVHFQSAGTAFYRTGGSRSEAACIARHPGDPLADATAAAARNGIALHAWVTCWSLTGVSPRLRTRLTEEDRLMRDASGNALPWLCPSVPENRRLIIEGLCDLAKRGVQGIHLDYVRYPESQGCYAVATRRAFETRCGASVARWPADVLPGGPRAAEFLAFRSETMTAFVREARDALRAVRPDIRLSAAVYPSPEAAARQSQDWPDWVGKGLLDFVCPMIYTESESAFASMLDACRAAVPAPDRTLVPGIGTGADESQLDALDAARQIRTGRLRHTAGFVFFAVDDALLTDVLPNLSLPVGAAH